jgi:AmmeMemoRadiSam system protein B
VRRGDAGAGRVRSRPAATSPVVPSDPLAACTYRRPLVVGIPRRFAASASGVVVDDWPHAHEHAIETQLPFLLRALGPAARVLPVLVGITEPAMVAALLAALLDGPGTVAVVSTDLSHYLSREQARERDSCTVAAVLARDGDALQPTDACGYWALRGLLQHAAELPHRPPTAVGQVRRRRSRSRPSRRVLRLPAPAWKIWASRGAGHMAT